MPSAWEADSQKVQATPVVRAELRTGRAVERKAPAARTESVQTEGAVKAALAALLPKSAMNTFVESCVNTVAGSAVAIQRRLMVLNDRNGRPVASLPVPASGSYIQLSVSDGRVLLSSNGTVISLGL